MIQYWSNSFIGSSELSFSCVFFSTLSNNSLINLKKKLHLQVILTDFDQNVSCVSRDISILANLDS